MPDSVHPRRRKPSHGTHVSRRSVLARSLKLTAAAAATGAGASLPRSAHAADAAPAGASAANGPAASFGLCLNTSTIRGANLPIETTVDIAARAGFNAIEPWIAELEAHEKKGGSLKDLGKKIKDLGLAVPSAIGFARWIVNDESERAKALEQMKRDMDKVAAVGGTAIAAPASGATGPKDPDVALASIAERYRAICEIGDKAGVIPEVEVWGFSKTLTHLADAIYVAVGSGHPKACVLPDVYHLHKGGSDPAGLALLSAAAIRCFHFNDYPADPPRETITDAHRVYPGDGVAPLTQILHTLKGIGFRGYLSLELFNKTYWKENPEKVAKAGVEKMKAMLAKAGIA